MSEFNPRYEAYASAQGFDPDTMLAVDRVLWPGGCMAGFMLWISERWSEFRRKEGLGHHDVLSAEDHTAFDEWIGAV